VAKKTAAKEVVEVIRGVARMGKNRVNPRQLAALKLLAAGEPLTKAAICEATETKPTRAWEALVGFKDPEARAKWEHQEYCLLSQGLVAYKEAPVDGKKVPVTLYSITKRGEKVLELAAKAMAEEAKKEKE
jgi:hypothetical protein